MKNKEFIEILADSIGRPVKEAEKLLNALGYILGEAMFEGKKIKLPGLGEFSSYIEDEKIEIDEATGKRILMPPCSKIHFEASKSLLSHITK